MQPIEPTVNKLQLIRILAVSFSYPPQSEPRAIQVSRLLRHLKVESVVICHGEATQGLDDAQGNNRTIRVPLPNSTLRDVSARVADRFNLPIIFRTPDHLRAWKNAVLKRVERLIGMENYRPEVVVTFSFPLIDAVIGLELKRRYGYPWLVHFSDPWIDSPFKNYDRVTEGLNRRLERMVMEKADRIVFTSPETAELVMKKYDRNLCSKVRTIPHAYERDLFDGSSGTSYTPLTIRFLGDLYQHRTPKPLFEALRQLAQSDLSLVKQFRFEIIGDVHQMDLRHLGYGHLEKDLVIFKPRVNYEESLELMTSASGLMVIDAPVRKSCKSVFLPSKLIEYIGAGLPILGLTPPGTAADLIRNLGGWIADPGDPVALKSVMREFLSFVLLHKDDQTPWGNEQTRKRFEAHQVAHEFQQVLNELCTIEK
jgi:glycosyltransferase involved in cell wall biosynthesis